jgi:predicted PurR-regulated permease PerM
MAATVEPTRAPVPWRTIWATIASVVATLAGIVLLQELGRILAWIVVALFFAVVLNPAVDVLTTRVRLRRGVATTIVIVVAFGALTAMLYAFIAPLVDQAQGFADDLPGYVEDAQNGEGTIGELVEEYELENWIDDNQDTLQDFVANLGTPALGVLRTFFTGLAAALTIMVLTVLMLLQAPRVTAAATSLVPERHRPRVLAVGRDCSRAVAGYIGGNVVISIIAGLSTWVVLSILGVPYAGVLGLWVAFTDLIPLIGATIGAIPTVGFAFLHSVSAGVITLIFFIAYQQFENHVLQVTVMSRTVKVNPLTVLISILIAVELFGFLGALLAIPGAGIFQVVARDLYDNRTGAFKDAPTVGIDEVPLP